MKHERVNNVDNNLSRMDSEKEIYLEYLENF